MTENETFNSTALHSTISGSATIHVMDRELIPWALYDLSEARASDSLAPMQEYCRRFRESRGESLDGIAYGALQSSWCA